MKTTTAMAASVTALILALGFSAEAEEMPDTGPGVEMSLGVYQGYQDEDYAMDLAQGRPVGVLEVTGTFKNHMKLGYTGIQMLADGKSGLTDQHRFRIEYNNTADTVIGPFNYHLMTEYRSLRGWHTNSDDYLRLSAEVSRSFTKGPLTVELFLRADQDVPIGHNNKLYYVHGGPRFTIRAHDDTLYRLEICHVQNVNSFTAVQHRRSMCGSLYGERSFLVDNLTLTTGLKYTQYRGQDLDHDQIIRPDARIDFLPSGRRNENKSSLTSFVKLKYHF